MSAAASFMAPPPRPPHDPLWQTLGGRAAGGGGWPLLPPAAGGVEHDPQDGALVLAPLPGKARVLGEANGSLGGLLLPGLMALDEAGTLWLIDHARRRLLWFDRCLCRFAAAPCQAALGLRDPGAVAVAPGRLFIADAGPPGRVLVLDPRALALRAVWRPPGSAPWQPTALSVEGGGAGLLVADAAGGALHRFASWGGSRVVATGIGALSRLALDCGGHLYGVVPEQDAVAIRDARSGRILASALRPAEVAGRFPDPPLPVARSGAVDLGGWCEGAGWFGPDGEALPVPPPDAAPGPAHPTSGQALLGPLDSRIARCVWHRAVLRAALPPHTGVALAAVAAETVLPEETVAALPEAAWTAVPAGEEALLQRAEGRYLWLRATLTGDGAATPRLSAIDVEYPRIGLRRHLPAAFGADPVSAEFADRFLAVFDRGFRDIEARLDDQAALFDPRSAPAAAPADMLGFLAGWIGLSLDRRWPEERRRRLVAEAARLFACRGTVPGLHEALLLWLGWDGGRRAARPAAPACAPRCAEPPATPAPPPLLLEHWKLRRWLFLGAGRLGDAAELWGDRILGRSQLDATAQAGGTRLDAVRDPLRDPFHRDAHRFSVFVPAHSVATPRARGALERLLSEQRPAGTEARVVPVHPRMRVGVQASLGFDAVVGCWPAAGVPLGAARLGRATVLPAPAGPPPLPPRLGRDSRLRPAPAAARAAPTVEAPP